MAAAMAAWKTSAKIPGGVGNTQLYLSVYDGVFAIDNDLARRGDHERRHHGRRLFSSQDRSAILPQRGNGGQGRSQLRSHGVYG